HRLANLVKGFLGAGHELGSLVEDREGIGRLDAPDLAAGGDRRTVGGLDARRPGEEVDDRVAAQEAADQSGLIAVADGVWRLDEDADPDLTGLLIELDVLDLADADAGAADRRARGDAWRFVEDDGVCLVSGEEHGEAAEDDAQDAQEDERCQDEQSDA